MSCQVAIACNVVLLSWWFMAFYSTELFFFLTFFFKIAFGFLLFFCKFYSWYLVFFVLTQFQTGSSFCEMHLITTWDNNKWEYEWWQWKIQSAFFPFLKSKLQYLGNSCFDVPVLDVNIWHRLYRELETEVFYSFIFNFVFLSLFCTLSDNQIRKLFLKSHVDCACTLI